MKKIIVAGVFFTSLFLFFCTGKSNKNKEKGVNKIPLIKNDTISNDVIEESVQIKMYKESVENFMSEGFCNNQLIVSIKSSQIKAYEVECNNEYGIYNYYEGELKDLTFQGVGSFLDNCGGGGLEESESMCLDKNKFKMQFSKDSTQITFSEKKYNLTTFIISIKKTKVYEQTNKKSKLIYDNKSISNIDLLEIGPLEKNGKEWNIWFKIKVDNKIGWILGGIIF